MTVNSEGKLRSLLDTAILHLSSRSCSEKELRKQLEKDFAHLPNLDEQLQAAIIRLRQWHLINDNRLAQSLAGRYLHKGNRFISQILRQKGLPDAVIAEVLDNLEPEAPRALDEARKKKCSLQEEIAEKRTIKLVRFLSGRGFSQATINTVLAQLQEEEAIRLAT